MNLTIISSGFAGLVAVVYFADSRNSAVCLDVNESRIKKPRKE